MDHAHSWRRTDASLRHRRRTARPRRPDKLIGHLTEPLLTPAEDELDGYVPNVVYSCGAILHGDHIIVPYGMADANVGVATVSIDQLLDRLT